MKAGATYAVLNPAPGVVESLGLPDSIRYVSHEEADHLLVFVNNRAELDSRMPSAVGRLAPGAALRIFFRKGSRAARLDMNRDDVWAIAESLDMRPLGLLGVDNEWSVFRLRKRT